MLQELGYVEGKNILVDYRDNEGDRSRVPGIVAELVRLKVDIIFSTRATVIREAKQATKSIPIVMATTVDTVRSGLVEASWQLLGGHHQKVGRQEENNSGCSERSPAHTRTKRRR